MSLSRSGGCLCGAVRYEAREPLRPVIACHCEQCRRTSGHHVAATAVARPDLTISGEPSWFQSSDTARRAFCPTCGSNLFWDGKNSSTIAIFAGTLDDASGLALTGHIYTADKGAYYEINDGLPCAAARDPKLTTQEVE